MRRWLIGLAAGVVVVGVGLLAYLWFSGGSGQPSSELTTPSASAAGGQGNTGVAGGPGRIFVIEPGNAEARFRLDEVYRGSPNLVVGVTDQVAGEIRVDLEDLAASQLARS